MPATINPALPERGALVLPKGARTVAAVIAQISPDEREAARQRIAAAIERLGAILDELIASLDHLDGDPDLEPNMGEPNKYGLDELEGALIGDDADAEPSLGWTATLNQTARQWHGAIDDMETEHDGLEPDCDSENGGDDEHGHDMEDCDLVAVSDLWPTDGAKPSQEYQHPE